MTNPIQKDETKRRVVVAGPCMVGACDCWKKMNADPAKVGAPPYHDGCVCYTVAVDKAGGESND